jgi:hypothetical protein
LSQTVYGVVRCVDAPKGATYMFLQVYMYIRDMLMQIKIKVDTGVCVGAPKGSMVLFLFYKGYTYANENKI